MSWLAPLLNRYLRLTEKPYMRRVRDPDALRRSFRIKARVFFHPPWGTQQGVRTLGPVEALRISPRRKTTDAVLLYVHGGGFVFGAPETHAAMVANLANRAGIEAILPRYPLAPEHPYPAAPDAVEACYHALRDEHPDRAIIMGGDSAAGALVLTVLARLLQKGAPLPAGVFALSPLTDLGYTGDSVRDNAAADVILPAERVHETAEMYLGTTAHSEVTDPDVSPLFADFTGAPPIWLTASATEILRDDSRRMADRLRAQGVPVTYLEEGDLPHVWPLFHNMLPEARRTLQRLSDWIGDQAGSSTPTR
ncbi:alpha/beta hydrolase [Tateyamaria sp. SN6-1]|uniref:alpha/beta hydrolase n=1 Tax=Tateyamaria sp. SN6-1 TaxID=3092148 RepID=UPI0039F55D89